MGAFSFLCGYMFSFPHCTYLVELALIARCVDCIGDPEGSTFSFAFFDMDD